MKPIFQFRAVLALSIVYLITACGQSQEARDVLSSQGLEGEELGLSKKMHKLQNEGEIV